MKTNDLKKGARIRLRNGWYGTIADNKKGDIRMAEVEGTFTEIGSVYAYDIVAALVAGDWVVVEHMKKQLKLQATLQALGI